MKEHESRLAKEYETCKFYRPNGSIEYIMKSSDIDVYIDSINLLHNLYTFSWFNGYLGFYFIHGVELSKQDWEIEVNRIKTLEEL